MKIYKGNLAIDKYNKDQYDDLIEVDGNLTIGFREYFKFKKLVKVTGWLTLDNGAELDAPKLLEVEEGVILRNDSNLKAIHLKTTRSLYLNNRTKCKAPELEIINGTFDASQETNADLSALKIIKGSVLISNKAKIKVPNLETKYEIL